MGTPLRLPWPDRVAEIRDAMAALVRYGLIVAPEVITAMSTRDGPGAA